MDSGYDIDNLWYYILFSGIEYHSAETKIAASAAAALAAAACAGGAGAV